MNDPGIERVLWQWLQSGDRELRERACTQLLVSGRPFVAGLVRSYGGGEEEIQEVLHEAVLVVVQKAETGRLDLNPGQLKAYFFQTAKYKWLDLHQKNQRHHRRFNETDPETLPISIPSTLQGMEKKEQAQQMALFLKQLDATCRELLRWVYYEGHTLVSWAEKQGVSEAAAKKRHQRCKEKLRNLMLKLK